MEPIRILLVEDNPDHAELTEIERGSGTQFDPDVVEAFLIAVKRWKVFR